MAFSKVPLFHNHMDILIRNAQVQDAEALCYLNDLFNGPGTVLSDVRAYLEGNYQEIIAVAQQDEKLIGFACAQVWKTFYELEPFVETTELYVLPEFRRNGVASRLMHFIENHCIEKYGNCSFRLLTGKDNLHAQKFYENLGYEVEDEVFYSK